MTHKIEDLIMQRILDLGSSNGIVVGLQIFCGCILESTVELFASQLSGLVALLEHVNSYTGQRNLGSLWLL